MFRRYIGIDYSGKCTPCERFRALAVCSIDEEGNCVFPPPLKLEAKNPSAIKNWNRFELAHWIIQELVPKNQDEYVPTLVGIDHGFSFPRKYFRKYGLPEAQECEPSGAAWSCFLADFRNKWPTHGQAVKPLMTDNNSRNAKDNCRTVDEQLNDHRWGGRGWKRLTDRHASGASSVFDFWAGARNVATQTHAGLPWLLKIREELAGANVHFWPFDGWRVPTGHSVIVEVYPSLWNSRFPCETAEMDSHRRDAYSVARWMWEHDRHDLLRQYFEFFMPKGDKSRAQTEGWIFGLLW